MSCLRILIIGDSRVLPRAWEGKSSYLEPKLYQGMKEYFPKLPVEIKTIGRPNNLMRYLAEHHGEIEEFFPDIIIFNLNLCEFIPRSLPLDWFTKFEHYCQKNPLRGEKIRKFLADNRRVLHHIFGKNAWNSESGYREDLTRELAFLSKMTKHVLYLGCLDTSDTSEYIRPGFRADIQRFNSISQEIVGSMGLRYLDLNPILQDAPYEQVSHDGIHYTDLGDTKLIHFIIKNGLLPIVNQVSVENSSVHMPKRPDYVQVELTNRCSVMCSMCELNHCTREKGYMTKETYVEIVRQLVEWEVPTIRFTLWGEALLHPEFIDYVKIAKSNNLRVGFNTNGILLTEKLMYEIIEAQVDEIIFSVDSFDDDEIYRLFRPSNRGIEDINNTILRLLEIREDQRSTKPLVKLQMIGSELNMSQHQKFLEYWTPKVDFCRVTHLYSMQRLDSYNESLVKEYDYFYECRYPWTTMGIYHNGDVTACCRDVNGALKVGNIHETALSNIYHSSLLTEMRKSLTVKNKEKMPKFCQSCYKYLLTHVLGI